MRIIAGTLKGRRLVPPDWPGLRPSSDRLRETLFNVLASRIVGARFLDLCAGTGAVGIEALSRGAAAVTFVDEDPRACALIAKNLAGCRVTERYTILRANADQAGGTFRGTQSIVFLDAPYADQHLDTLVNRAAECVASGGVLVVEHARRRALTGQAGRLVQVRDLRSGDSCLSFFAESKTPGASDEE
ncbi:MAG: 16S rRNA (guanine(966)-N(2))-methyltransferase RsmD [Vicinamibacterales bacterium]